MLTGSLAAAFYAIPRATQDIDLVLEVTEGHLDDLVRAVLATGLYVDPDAAREALRQEGRFTAIDPETGWKVDFIIRRSRAFSLSEFGRRRREQVLGLELYLVSLEDLIIAKLEWAQKGESGLQLMDVQALLRSSPPNLDRPYMDRWIGELGLTVEWDVAQKALEAGSG